MQPYAGKVFEGSERVHQRALAITAINDKDLLSMQTHITTVCEFKQPQNRIECESGFSNMLTCYVSHLQVYFIVVNRVFPATIKLN